MIELKGISVFSGKPASIKIDGAKISAVEELPEKDGDELPYICPGFLDLQVNGFNGIDYSLEDLSANQIEALCVRLAASGTTKHAPTFVTMPNERLLRNLSLVAETMEKRAPVKAGIAGFHIEGPFISPEDGPRGAHDKNCTRLPDFSLFEKWQQAAKGNIRIITLAPELPGGLEFIKKAAEAGVKVCIGHTAAAPEQIQEAIAAGAVCSTHLGNGSHAQLPRLKNYIWEQMAADSLWAGIICDGFHLPRSVVKTISRAKGFDKIFMVSDAALLGGYKPGFYKWGNLDVEVYADGHLGIAGGNALAGAAHMLDWDIARFMEFTGVSLRQALALCTIQPAKFLGLDTAEYSSFTPGNTANLTLFRFSAMDKKLNICRTICNGETVYLLSEAVYRR
jgi:N-acetylglucosamine-6-phosphate deacetylase